MRAPPQADSRPSGFHGRKSLANFEGFEPLDLPADSEGYLSAYSEDGFAWHAGAIETVRALGVETSIALACLLGVVLVVSGILIVHEERKRKQSSTMRIKKES